MKATQLLRSDHRHIEHLLGIYLRAPRRPAAAKWLLFELIDRVICLQHALEDQRFFPTVDRIAGRGSGLAEARAQHAAIRALLLELRRTPVGADFDRLMGELDRLVRRHQREEEVILMAVEDALGTDGLERLGAALQAQKSGLAARMQIATSGAPE